MDQKKVNVTSILKKGKEDLVSPTTIPGKVREQIIL